MTDDLSRTDEDELRARAVKRLRKRRDFYTHVAVYVLVNALLVVIWAVTTPGGFFWPVFPMAAWGIGLAMNAWDVYRQDDFDEERISKEVRHLQRTR